MRKEEYGSRNSEDRMMKSGKNRILNPKPQTLTPKPPMKNILFIIALSGLCACSASTEKFTQIKKDMNRTEVIEIMGRPTEVETLSGIETLTYEYDRLDRIDLYLILLDTNTQKVLESTYTSEPAPDSFIEKWKWYLARKIYKIK